MRPDDELEMDDHERWNRHAEYLPARDHEEVPAIRIGGILVMTYIRDGTLQVSIDLDDTDPRLTTPDGTVPAEITMQGNAIFTAGLE